MRYALLFPLTSIFVACAPIMVRQATVDQFQVASQVLRAPGGAAGGQQVGSRITETPTLP